MYSAVVSMVGLSVKYPYNYQLFMFQVHYDCKNIEIALWLKSYSNFAECVDFAYWWSFRSEGSASVACAAGFFP